MVPRKICAKTFPVKLIPLAIPGRRYAGTTALIDSGIVMTAEGKAVYCAAVGGASEAPIFTVCAVISVIPPELPMLL